MSSFIRLTLSRIYFLALIVVLQCSNSVFAQSNNLPYNATKNYPIEAYLEKGETHRKESVIVRLNLFFRPKGLMSDQGSIVAQEAGIAALQAKVIDRLESRFNIDKSSVTRFRTIPYFVVEVDANDIESIKKDPDVASVTSNVMFTHQLYESGPLIGADIAHDLKYTGAGQAVVIIDSGILQDHPFLSSQVIHEACFATNRTTPPVYSLCDSGRSEVIEPGSARACPASMLGCGHGTHIAGIVAGKRTLTNLGKQSGIAPDARLIIIKTESYVPAISSNSTLLSDLIRALEHVESIKQYYSIAAINLSLGYYPPGSNGYTDTNQCDHSYEALKAIIDSLRASGIATIVASGNEGHNNALASPACLSSVISVGASTKDDVLASYSNTAPFLKLLAPGGEEEVSGDLKSIFSSGIIMNNAEALYRHTCGVQNDGKLSCWGFNDDGQANPPDGSFVQVSGGYGYSCALGITNQLSCWGSIAAPPAGTYEALDGGFAHACAIQRGTRLPICWGSNAYGELLAPPVPLSQISAGFHHNCGVTTSGNAVCWGHNNDGQATPPGGNFIQVSAGTYHSCGLRGNGGIVCWGSNNYWGNSFIIGPPAGAGFSQITTGSDHDCALHVSGYIECWGGNDSWQAVQPDGMFTQVSAGKDHSCAVKSDGRIVCWGSNAEGQTNIPPDHPWLGFTFSQGTSMAAPHVAGAWAVLKSKKPEASIDDILAALQSTGKPILNIISGNIFPRISLPDALEALDEKNTLAVTKAGTGSGNVQSIPPGIDCGADCEEDYPSGTTVILTAVADDDSKFTGWGGACVGVDACTIVSNGASRVTATFEKAYPLTVTKKGAGSGAVKGMGIDCGDFCTNKYAIGTTVTLAAYPEPDSVFSGWSDSCQGAETCTVIMNSAKQVVANFSPKGAAYPLTIKYANGGLITSTPEGINCGSNNRVCKGLFSNVILTAVPNPGFYLKNWVGCPSPSGSTCTLSLTQETMVKPVFAKMPTYTIKLTKTKGGSIHIEQDGNRCKDNQIACSFKYVRGTILSLTASPAPGRSFMIWGGACSGNQNCSIVMDGNKKVSAVFQ